MQFSRSWAAVAVIMLGGCLPMGEAEQPAPAQQTCSSAYPSGVLQGVGCNPQFHMSYQLTAHYQLDDERMAREALPGDFTRRLNSAAAGTGTSFVAADGSAGNFIVELTATKDATDDHYGLSVAVFGQEDMQCTGYGSGETRASVQLFGFYLEPLYITTDKMLDDAAARIVTFITKGWTCS